MATKKSRPAAKKPVKRSASRAPKTSYEIPEGFQLPASAQIPNWDYEKNRVLEGECIAIKTITKKKPRKGESKTTRVMSVRDEEGNLWQVWESGWLHGFFDEVKQGAEVWIAFEGLGEKVKGRMQAKMFKSAFKNPEKQKAKRR